MQIELPAQDTEALAHFYENVFGWKLIHEPRFNYWMFDGEGGPGGGFVNAGGEVDPNNPVHYELDHPVIYLNSDDIEGDLERVVAAGGKVVMPSMEIPMTGWMAFFTDPAGNRMALYKNMPQPEQAS